MIIFGSDYVHPRHRPWTWEQVRKPGTLLVWQDSFRAQPTGWVFYFFNEATRKWGNPCPMPKNWIVA